MHLEGCTWVQHAGASVVCEQGGLHRPQQLSITHTHTPSLPASGSWRKISELFGVSSSQEWKTGTVAAANELLYHRYWMMILQLSEAGRVISNALGWREGEQTGQARRGKGRGIINWRPHYFLALSLWQCFIWVVCLQHHSNRTISFSFKELVTCQ